MQSEAIDSQNTEYDEVVAVTDTMRLGKMTGIDEVSPEYIKFKGKPLATVLTSLFGKRAKCLLSGMQHHNIYIKRAITVKTITIGPYV